MADRTLPPLILASASPYRRELLTRLGLDFEVMVSGADETLLPGETSEEAVLRLAALKAEAVAARRPDALVLASDQLASLDGVPLGKPRDLEDAARQLHAVAGRVLTYVTAVVLARPGPRARVVHLDRSRVALRHLDEEEIERYLERERPLDCAGSLKLEGLGAALCASIETADPSALIGLPLIAVARLLREAGWRLP